MSIAKVSKILIIGHSSEKNLFVETLQQNSIVHIDNFNTTKIINQTFQSEAQIKEINQVLKETQFLKDSLDLIKKYQVKKDTFQNIINPFYFLTRSKYNKLVNSVNISNLKKEIDFFENKLTSLKNEKEKIISIINSISDWNNLENIIDHYGNSIKTFSVLGVISESKINKIKEEYIEYEIISKKKKIFLAVFCALHENQEKMQQVLTNVAFEKLKVINEKQSIKNNYKQAKFKLDEISKEENNIKKKITKLISKIKEIKVLIHYFESISNRNNLYKKWIKQKNYFIISAWIKNIDLERMKKIKNIFKTVEYEIVPAEKNEKPPVAFSSSFIFKPFNLITKLYSLPAYKSYDTTIITSIFFALFFGICITDAMYGIILVLFSIIAILKLKKGRDLFWIFLWGGIFSIISGVLTGGYFGDLIISKDFIVISKLKQLVWFDPMNQPMIFFRLVLGLGVIQVFTGLIIGIFQNIKLNDFKAAFYDNFVWLVLLSMLLIMLFSSNLSIEMSLVSSTVPIVNENLMYPAMYLSLLCAIIIWLFSAREQASLTWRLFIGFLRLVILNGFFSYIADVLSYIRLMALGMVTAGIAMAINNIAIVISNVKYIGIILAVIILISGHLFNIAISILSGFVHTLRLQYVEFFSKFFVSGGRPFVAFSESDNYVKIID